MSAPFVTPTIPPAPFAGSARTLRLPKWLVRQSLQADPLPPRSDAGVPSSRFVLWRPGSLLFWLIVAFIALGAWQFFDAYGARYLGLDPGAWGVIVAWTLPLAAVIAITLRLLDPLRGVPGDVIAVSLLWGAFVAVTLALFGNEAFSTILQGALSPTEAERLLPPIAAPLTEEWGKGMGVLALFLLRPAFFRRPVQGLVAGGFVGLGFQLQENLTYAVRFGLMNPDDDVAGAGLIIAVRTLVGTASHWTFTALFGFGVAMLLGRTVGMARRTSLLLGVLGIAGAWFGHASWNYQPAGTPDASLLLFMLLKQAFTIGLFVVFALIALRQEERWSAAVMQGVAPGLIDPVDAAVAPRAMRVRARSGLAEALAPAGAGRQARAHYRALERAIRQADAAFARGDERRLREALRSVASEREDVLRLEQRQPAFSVHA